MSLRALLLVTALVSCGADAARAPKVVDTTAPSQPEEKSDDESRVVCDENEAFVRSLGRDGKPKTSDDIVVPRSAPKM